MKVSHITTKTDTFYGAEIVDTFHSLVNVGHPFSVWIDMNGSSFPVPFINGVSANYKVEKCVQDTIRRVFGQEVHFS